MQKGRKTKILIVDIETAPKTAFVWGLWNQNIHSGQLIQDTYVLTWCAKWLDDDYIHYDALHYHKDTYAKDPTDDTEILKSVHKLLDEADIVVAHNGDRFDLPTLNARFVQKNLPPPSTYQSVDTLKIAKRAFRFTSNRLDDLGVALQLGRKMDTGGFSLWREIVQNKSKKAFDKMVEYCQQDVYLLESVYKTLRSWDKGHPSTVVQENHEEPHCNVCGSTNVIKNGSYSTNTNTYQKYKCVAVHNGRICGHNMRHRRPEKKSDEQKNNLLRSN